MDEEIISITRYIRDCRRRLEPLLEHRYRIAVLWRIQRPHLRRDLWRLAVNSAWAIPRLAIKKAVESLDRLGWSAPLVWTDPMPMGFRTSLQDHFEKMIETEVFRTANERVAVSVVEAELRKCAQGRAVWASVSTTLTTLTIGWLVFDEERLNLLSLVERLIDRLAVNRAAGDFVLGESIGRSFYGVFSPEASLPDYVMAMSIVVLVLAAVSFVSAFLYHPIRSWLGIEAKKLHAMIDTIEERLLLEAVARHRRKLPDVDARGDSETSSQPRR